MVSSKPGFGAKSLLRHLTADFLQIETANLARMGDLTQSRQGGRTQQIFVFDIESGDFHLATITEDSEYLEDVFSHGITVETDENPDETLSH